MNVYAKFRCAPLRIKKASGIFGPLEKWFQEQEQLEWWLFGSRLPGPKLPLCAGRGESSTSEYKIVHVDVTDDSRRKRRNFSVYSRHSDVNRRSWNPAPMTTTSTTADRCRRRQPRSRCLSRRRHCRRCRDCSRGPTSPAPAAARWQSSELRLVTYSALLWDVYHRHREMSDSNVCFRRFL